MGLLFALVAMLVVGPMFGAALAPYDDHELPTISRELVSLGPVPTLTAWLGEHRGRFRPAYWVLRVAETAVWGENVTGWYLDRLLLLLVSLAAGYGLVRLWFTPAVAVLAAALIVAGPQAEAFGRLGPQEAYAVLMALVGLALVGRHRFAWGLALLAVSAFTKETFVPFAALGIAWAWYLGARRSAALAACAAALALAGGIVRVVSDGALMDQGRDLTSVLATGVGMSLLLIAITGWPLAAVTRHRRWLLVIGLAILVPQAVILAGLPYESRYLYPVVFGGILAAAAAAAHSRVAYLAIAVILLVNLGSVSQAGLVRAEGTRDFAGIVDRLRASDLPIVVHVRDVAVVETAGALRRYLPDASISMLPVYPFAPYPAADPVIFAVYSPGPCIEVDVATGPLGVCSEALRLP